ncbi:hypothetical protein BN1211_3769 [Cyberlindnera jadinii]|uniref:Serine/threonine-protein kinase MEC1 n=1 Tax=Cyberlindnera jadinii (strain ATCC 18201 / CBS 1600 / BCRC 20928 / JCM 3617 / NBRC 0987 / NRRL Y-1542) TaxID=983966 RepID=A0A0H5C5H9_CYBJN|nr:hypothetical protein BN1211_3769 [Cyberlindnera jadinii]
MNQTVEALKKLVDSAIGGVSFDDESDETQIKMLDLILTHGVSDNQPPAELVCKCLKAIETICEKNPQLLHHTTQSTPTYRWILTTLIHSLDTGNEKILRSLKSAMITVVYLTTTKLQSSSYKAQVREFFTETLESFVSSLFKQLSSVKLCGLLAICTNLFSLMVDTEMMKKMMIDPSFDQVFETAARKMEFVLSAQDNPLQSASMDSIKSHMVISLLNYCMDEDYITVSRLKYFLAFCENSLQPQIVSSQPRLRSNIAYSLMKVLGRCLDEDNAEFLKFSFDLPALKNRITSVGDNTLCQVINLIEFAVNPSVELPSVSNALDDQLLDQIRLEIIAKLQQDQSNSPVDQLLLQTGATSLSSWINSLKQLEDLSRTDLYRCILSLGDFVCKATDSYIPDLRACSVCCSLKLFEVIDYDRPNMLSKSNVEKSWTMLLGLLSSIPENDSILEMAALESMHKFFAHFQPPNITPTCQSFVFWRRLLSSPHRNTRILAVKSIPFYIKSKHNLYESCTGHIMKIANSFDLESYPYLVESTVMVWGQLAISTESLGIHSILLKLVGFLNSQSSFKSSMAFHEIEMISAMKEKTPWKLLSLVLPSCSVNIARQMATKPAVAQRISDLLGVPLNQILWRYHSYTIPYLLTYYQRDIIAEIAASREGKTKLELVLTNKSQILAFLLTSLSDPSEGKIIGILSNACPEISKTSLSAIIGSPLGPIWELLKIHGADGKSDELIMKSIRFVLQLATPEVSSEERVSRFFQKNTLGIVNLFTDAIRDTKGFQPYDEKLKSFRAIELLVQISGPEEAHLVTLLDQSIATVIQKWQLFDHRCKLEARKLIGVFLEKSNSFKEKHLYTFYSLADNDDLAEMYSKIFNAIRKTDKPHALLNDITRRCKHDNKFVVCQALVDLGRFLNEYNQEFYNTYLLKPSFAPMVSNLLGALLDILNKFKTDDNVTIKCSQCLGQIGALDPAKFEVEKKKDQIILASDFTHHGETIKFLLTFLNDYLVPSFWASEDPTKQVFLAYAMQEFLKLSGLDSTRFDVRNPDVTSPEYILWSQFSDVSQSTLTPLVSSKYTASVSKYTPLKYPIFDVTWDHSKWLRHLTLDLLKRGTQPVVSKIFTTCSSLVKEQNISFCNFLLPYAALHAVISDEILMTDVRLEIMTVLETDIESVHHMAADNLRMSYETVFNLLDYFRKWVFARKQFLKRKGVKKTDPWISTVAKLLESIPQQLMAKRSYQANSYERAVLYLEQCYRSDTINEFGSSFFGQLQNMYASIGDYDALDGVLKTFSNKTLEDRITELEYSDNWKMAQDCLNTLGKVDLQPLVLDPDTRLLKSLFDHNLYEDALNKLDSLLTVESKVIKKDWLDIGLEASILSGNKEFLRKWISYIELHREITDSSNLVYYHLGKVLLNPGNLGSALLEDFNNAFLLLGSDLGLDRRASLRKNRSQFVLLHSVTDVQNIIKSSHTNFSKVKTLLNMRRLHTGNDFRSNWTISSIRRAADSCVSDLTVTDIGELWLNSSKSARKNNRLDLATPAVIQAIGLKSVATDLEYAKILWAQGDQSRALALMEDLKLKTLSDPRRQAKVQLKYTEWLDLSNNSSSSKIIEEYTRAIKIDPTWEKPYYTLGKFYNKLLELKSKSGQSIDLKDISGELERKTISFYLKSLLCGTKYLYEALPKVVTVWLDFAENISEVPVELSDSMKVTALNDRKKNITGMLEEIHKYSEKFPAYYWYTVLSQVLSRILHSHSKTAQLLIIISQFVVNEYPSHALWSVLAQYKSVQKERERKGKVILDMFGASKHDKARSGENTQILEKSKKLFNQLMAVSKRKASRKGTLSLRDDFEFDYSVTPSPLVVPVKTNFDITLPLSVQAIKNHNAFPSSSRVTIAKFENRVDVLSSMQQPKHLFLRGSDGLIYGILCKPNDDLRKDAKLMEFTSRVDHLLKKNYDSEQRKLHIKTYAVIPLNENYGIIEWVENSRTMRDILKVHYANINVALDVPHIRKVLDMDCDIEEKAEKFQTEIIAKYPPVLYAWFIENFPDPSSWYEARNNYTQTTAVMSMVGYMLGLGDRHGENILLNEKDGGVLHVDFDCLFEKGLELSVPERVPFRLTHNMVDAFGITGVEGTFRKSCEVTLRLIRANETPLMNILESFLHDPIMDWSQKRRNRNTPQAALSTIRRKIRGILDKEGIPMSVDGQTGFLIQQATSVENLCQMYIGWMAFW